MKKEFKVYSPLTSKSVQKFISKEAGESADERIMLEGIASTTSRDLHDEIVSADAIESMSQQALALNIHASHWYGLEDVVGAIKESTVEDKQLKVKFLITKKYTPDIKDLLDTGVKLGLSIGGYVTNYDEKNRIINEIELHEISLTPMPANWDTFGTVTTSKGLVESNCVAGACYAIVKTLNGGDKMDLKKEEAQDESSGVTEDRVIELINEYLSEKEETIAQEITDKVESQLESIVEAKLQEALDDSSSSEDETKATEEEEDEEKPEEPQEENSDEEDEEKEKSFNPNMIEEAIQKGIDNALGDDFAEKVAAKMFGDLEQTRTASGSKYEAFKKSLGKSEEEEEPTEKSNYSSKEAAEIMMKKHQATNPLNAAIMKNLE